jgi:uncharacterized protein YjbJ (UPF0337 family)
MYALACVCSSGHAAFGAASSCRARRTGARQVQTKYEEDPMNWDQLEGKWKQYIGKVKEKWGKLTDDDLEVVGGRRDQLIGKIQERYGIVKQEAEKQVDEFARSFRSEDSTEGTHPIPKEKKRGAGQS